MTTTTTGGVPAPTLDGLIEMTALTLLAAEAGGAHGDDAMVDVICDRPEDFRRLAALLKAQVSRIDRGGDRAAVERLSHEAIANAWRIFQMEQG